MLKGSQNQYNEIEYSIIIPIYNCEQYLEKCILSVINQHYKNFELILINDGSTDCSDTICKKYRDIDSRVKYISKKNSGVSDTRNKGLDIAKGKMILFLDSDDYVENDYLSSINDILKKYPNLELINFGFFSDVNSQDNKTLSSDIINTNFLLMKSKSEINKNLIQLWDKHMLYNIWNKVYFKRIIDENKLKFPNYNFGEDMEFNKKYLENVNVFLNSDKCFYHYVKERNGSITSSYKKDLFDIRVKEYLQFNDYFKSLGFKEYEYQEFSSRRFIERVLGCVENICGSCIKSSEKKKQLKRIINNKYVRKSLKTAKPNSKKIKLMLFPIKIKSVFLLSFMGNTISFIRKRFPGLFNRMKNKR